MGLSPGAAALTADEEAVWQVRAALLDPEALVLRSDAFDVTLAADEYVVNAWACYIENDTAQRLDIRAMPQPDLLPPLLPAGTRLRGLQTGAQVVTIDPTLVSYADPRAKWHERWARIPSLTHQSDGVNSSSATSRYLDTTRAVYASPPAAFSGGAVSGDSDIVGALFGATQRFSLPVQVNSGQTVEVAMLLERTGSQTGDLNVQIRTNSGGNPTGTILASATIASASLPTVDGGPEWVTVTLSALTANLVAGTQYHLQLTTAATDCCSWKAAQGSYAAGTFLGRRHNGSAWVNPTGFFHHCCKVRPSAQVHKLVTAVVAFDTPWVIMYQGHMDGGVNTWHEINDVDAQRFGGGVLYPWRDDLGMQWRMNGGSAASKGTIQWAELPSDW